MEDIQTILSELQREHIRLKLKGNDLQVVALKKKLAPDTIRKIKANKQALVTHLKKMQEAKKSLHIPKLEPQESYPLSPGQQRIWILSQFEEGMLAYQMSQVAHIDEAIDVENFRRAVAAVVERHEILRTIFKEDTNGVVRQWILPAKATTHELHYIDFSGEANPMLAFENYSSSIANQPFKLDENPLFRGSLIKVSATNYIFQLHMHHIIGDAWSMNVLRDDIMRYYRHFHLGESLPITSLRIHYKDYSSWQISRQKSEVYKSHQTYWKDIFKGEIPLFNLPSTKKRPKRKTYNGTGWSAQVPTSLYRALQTFTNVHGGSTFMALLAGWNAICYRYTDAKDQIVGTPVSSRVHKELENQIGFYINTLALRNTIEDSDTFASLHKRIKQHTLEAYNHQEYPFDQLVDDISLSYDSSRSALFDVLFTVHQLEEGAQTLTATEMIEAISIKFDIEFAFHEAEDQLRYMYLYNADVYDVEMMQQLVQHYFQLLEKILVQPEQTIRTIDYLTTAEKTVLLEDFKGKVVPYDQTETLISLFQQQVQKTPHNIAVVFNETEVTYTELDAVSNQLAQYLVETYHIQADELISLKLPRSEWMIITILAVLKSGGAYVPIDPAYPEQRIDYIETDTNCKLSIDEAELKRFRAQQSNYSKTYAGIHPKPTDLAYIIYTSGSTGKPKGVMIEHRSISNYLQFNTQVYGFDANDVTLLVSTYCFDISLNQIFNTILTGGKLIVSQFGYNELDELIQKHKLTWLDGTSSMSEFIPSEKSSLQKIFLGGEPLKDTVVEKFKHQQLYNGYGPTECTVTTSRGEIHKGKPITIGSPVHNASYYVLQDGILCPIGVPGELHISGIGLARGYHNKPELTAEKFVNNPFVSGERMYKTGDLVRWLSDGTIEFLGRLDDQVKLRGYRIELGAIEKSLTSHMSIRESVVLVRELSGQQELIGYYVSDEALEASELRSHLATRLPQYMLPAYYVHLEHMPLNSNGKIAKKTLPNPEIMASDQVETFRAATTALEKQVVSIWENILDRKHIGLDDDFFVLGGHSLRATRLLNAYHKTFEVRLALSDLFAATTVASQVQLLAGAENDQYETIPQLALQEDYAVSSGQHRLWILSQFKEGSLAYHMPSFVYLEGDYDLENFQKAVHAVVARHEILRTVFIQKSSGEVRQRIIPKEETNFKINYHDFSQQADSETAFEQYRKQDAQQAFDLENGPLFRCSLVQLAENQYAFYYNLHHIISDGWSMGILRKDILQYYQQYQNGTVVSLQPLRIQYKDYSQWQQSQQSEASFVAQRDYWLQTLSGELPLLDLPTTKVRPKVKTFNGFALGTQIPNETYKRIHKFTEQYGGSTFMVLLSSWQAIFYRYSGVRDQIIGTPTSGRTHKELENQIGFYINTLALRNTVMASDSYASFYKCITQNTLESFTHQTYPFDRLVDELQIHYDTSRSALFDVLLSYDILEDGVEGSSFGHEILEFGEAVVNFDIRIEIQDQGDQLNYKLIFNQDVYDKDLMKQLMKHYAQLLDALLTNADTAIDTVDYLQDDEKSALLPISQAESYVSSQTVVSLFETQVKKFSERTALVYEGKQYTYQELDALSNQFAHYILETYPIHSNDYIAVKLEHTEWLIVVMMGILKAGCAYVPIDPTYPQERIDYIENDTQCSVSIDQQVLANFQSTKDTYSKTAISKPVLPTDTAYIIYTSGSTGKPKGVIITHQNLTHLFAHATQKLFDFTENDVWCLFHSYCFDFSVWELFGAILSGGKLIIIPKKQRVAYEALTQLFVEEGITVFNQTPTSFQALQSHFIKKADMLSIRYLIFGGEKLENTILQSWQQHFPTCRIINMYGITETTVHNTFKELTANDITTQGSTIGKPIPGIDIQVLDANHQLVPHGVTGEMYVTGDGVANAYLNRPEITQERFVEITLHEQTRRYYKTGDLAKRLSNGELQYIGRIDDQVKIRGHRIEVDEVNAALNSHESINASIVIAQQSEVHGATELVAYYVCKPHENVTENQLRSHVAARLPEFMVPTFFIGLEAMPLTVNGKIDKKQLPKPSAVVTATETAPEVAISATGKKIIQLWEDILQKQPIGLYDDFFDLGGYSLTVALMLNKLKEIVDIDMHIVDFYEDPTIENILNQATDTPTLPNKLLTLSEGNHQKSIYYMPLSHGIGFVFKPLADYLSDSYNNYTFQSKGMLGDEAVATTFQEEAEVYADCIIENSEHTEAILFGFSFGGYTGYETAKILEEKGFSNYKLIILDVIPEFQNIIDKNSELENLQQYVATFGATFDPDLVQRSLRVAENNLSILTESYQVSGKIKNKIIGVQATNNTNVLNMNSWEPFTTACVVSVKLPSKHGEMMETQHFQSLKNILDS